MPSWLLKTAIHHVIARLPYRQKCNEFFQKYGTRSLTLGEGMFARRLEHCRIHIENYLELHPEAGTDFTALEIGTGWYPTIAVGLYLCGAREVWGMDIDPLISRERVHRMMELYCEFDDRGELKKHLPRLLPERMARLREAMPSLKKVSGLDFLEQFKIHILVRDAQQTGLRDRSVDLFFSSGVVEYIPMPVLKGIFSEFRRTGTSRAVMSHWISFIDQFSYFDQSITPYNYLRYTSKQWKFLNSPMIWQSRLVIPQYRQALAETGYVITKEESVLGKPEDLARIALAPEFRQYKQEDLRPLTTWMVARPIQA